MVYELLEAVDEETDVVTIDEAVVDGDGDVEQHASLALGVAPPVDAGYGIVGIAHGGIGDAGAVERGSTGVIDEIGCWRVASVELRLLGNDGGGGGDELGECALETSCVDVVLLLVGTFVGEVGLHSVVEHHLPVDDAQTEVLLFVECLRHQVDEREVERKAVTALIVEQVRHVDVHCQQVVWHGSLGEHFVHLAMCPVLEVEWCVHNGLSPRPPL